MGRGTKEDEANAYLAGLGLDAESVLAALKERAAIEIPDAAGMVSEFREALYVQMKLGELGSTALVQGLKAVAVLAEADKQSGPEDTGPERGIDDILADAGLPPERRRDIGRQELERLHARAAALELVVNNITEAS